MNPRKILYGRRRMNSLIPFLGHSSSGQRCLLMHPRNNTSATRFVLETYRNNNSTFRHAPSWKKIIATIIWCHLRGKWDHPGNSVCPDKKLGWLWPPYTAGGIPRGQCQKFSCNLTPQNGLLIVVICDLRPRNESTDENYGQHESKWFNKNFQWNICTVILKNFLASFLAARYYTGRVRLDTVDNRGTLIELVDPLYWL